MGEHFYIKSELNGLVLDIEGASQADCAKLITWNWNGQGNQKFHYCNNGFLRSAHSGKVLDVEGGVGQGNKIIQYTPHGGANQRWRFHPDGTIRLDGFDLCLDIEGCNSAPGAHIIAWPYNGGRNQKWRIERA